MESIQHVDSSIIYDLDMRIFFLMRPLLQLLFFFPESVHVMWHCFIRYSVACKFILFMFV